MTDVCDRIVQLWIAHDDAGDRLAEQHLDEQRMKAIIDGAQNPSTYDIAAIAVAFGVTEAWLLTGDDHGLDAEEQQALREETIAARWHVRAEKAEADLAIAEQHIERGNIENEKAWREVRSLLRVLRPLLLTLPDECRYHGAEIDPPAGRYSAREACCDSGIPALRRRNAQRVVGRIEAEHTTTGGRS